MPPTPGRRGGRMQTTYIVLTVAVAMVAVIMLLQTYSMSSPSGRRRLTAFWRTGSLADPFKDVTVEAFGVTYHGAKEWSLLPPMPGAPWESALALLGPSALQLPPRAPGEGPRKKIGVFLNTRYHWDTSMGTLMYLCMSGRYDVYFWTAPAWPFNATFGRDEWIRAYPYCYELYTGQVELDAMIVASHTYATWESVNDEQLVANDPHYKAWLARSPLKRLVFSIHELAVGSLKVLDHHSEVRVLAIGPLAYFWDVPHLTMARTFFPPLPFRGFGGVRRLLLQGNVEDAKRDYQSLARVLHDPLLLPFAGAFEVLFLGSTIWGSLPPLLLAAPGFRVVEVGDKKDKHLDEMPYHEVCRSAHFILPAVSPRRNPEYFTTRMTSSVFLARAYRVPLVAHEALVRTSGLPRGVALAYSDTDGTFLAAFLAALRMSETEYAEARAAYAPLIADVDAANVETLRGLLEDP